MRHAQFCYFAILHNIFSIAHAKKRKSADKNVTPDKFDSRRSSEIEYWDVKPKVRGSKPRVNQMYRVDV